MLSGVAQTMAAPTLCPAEKIDSKKHP